jgi:cytochrome c oxidase subunit II
MPPRVRRTLLSVVSTGLAVLATAGIAAADGGGFAPPAPASPNAHHINEAYWLVFIFTAAIFVIVETALVVFIVRYRSRTRDRRVEGPELHGHTRLELIWTAIPIVIVSAIFGFVFYKLPSISGPSKALAAGETSLKIKIDAHQFYWQFTYPNGSTSIDELHIPLGRVVELSIDSEDVDHSWWIPNLGGKTDAIPGRTNHTWYKPEKLGTFHGQCAELCGLFHEAMLATVVVESPADYQSFIATGVKSQLGKMEWQGVCAKCHGMQGQGDYGPAINANPLLTQPNGLEDIVRNGRGRMPAVGDNWNGAQFRALESYLKSSVYKGAASGG